MTAHNWRADTLQDAVAGIVPIETALYLVGARGEDLATKARQDLTDAAAAHKAGDTTNAMATAVSLAEAIKAHRNPRKVA